MKKQITKSIEIKAPKENVWEVLLNDRFTRQWYAEFSEGSHADTDWKLGSKAIFTDHSGSGIFGTIIANEPFKLLSIEYLGFLNKGVEEYEGKIADSVKGSVESYRLLEENNITKLFIECDMEEAMYEMMSAAWEKALEKIKAFSENLAKETIVAS
jgi:uncharacterized protein YndB with AHSA1/START domain